jgi:hypothetical protein
MRLSFIPSIPSIPVEKYIRRVANDMKVRI